MGLPATQRPPRRVSAADYLRFERDSRDKHEFHDGVIVAMAGGSPDHSLVIANALAIVHSRLKGGPCRVYDSNLRVLVARSRRYVYPDASVICGPVEYDPGDEKRQTATNPKVIVEVLSPSTEAYDRGEKFRRYLELASFEEYVMVSQTAPVLETVYRQPDGSCVLRVYQGMDAVARVQSLGIDLPLSDVFAGVTFPPPPEEPTPPGPIEPPPGT
jgi:Uma2 family endonuclease